MSEEPKSHESPRPWRVNSLTGGHISDANGDPVCFCVGSNCGERAALIVDAVNLKTRIDEAMADESGHLHPVVLDGKPMVCVTPPPSEAEESRMHREYEASLLVDRERLRRCFHEANSTGGPISITRRDLAKLRGDLDEAFRRQVDYAATFWSTTNDRIAAEDAYLRGALKICIKKMCEYCRADAAHSMPGKECVEGCETLRLVKKALGEEGADHA